MMDNRKRRDGVGALFLCYWGWRRRQNSGIFLCFCLLRGARGPATVEFVRIRERRRRPTHIVSDPGGGQSTRRMLFASVHKQVSALRSSVQDCSSVYSRAGITNKFGMRHCIFMKQSTRRMLFASVHKQVSALRSSVQDCSSVYSRAGITNKFGMRHCIFMKQKSTSANSNVLFKTIQNVCLACKETGLARLGEFHR